MATQYQEISLSHFNLYCCFLLQLLLNHHIKYYNVIWQVTASHLLLNGIYCGNIYCDNCAQNVLWRNFAYCEGIDNAIEFSKIVLSHLQILKLCLDSLFSACVILRLKICLKTKSSHIVLWLVILITNKHIVQQWFVMQLVGQLFV